MIVKRRTWARFFTWTYWRIQIAAWWTGKPGLNVIETFEVDMAENGEMKVGIRAKNAHNWSVEVYDLETGRALPIYGPFQINVDANWKAGGLITANATILISSLDIKEAQLSPEFLDLGDLYRERLKDEAREQNGQ